MKFHLLKQAVIGPQVPMAVFENIYTAKENDLKVILFALEKNTADAIEISGALQISLAAVQSSLLYWADKGLIMVAEEQQSKPKKKKTLSAQEILQISQDHPEIEILVNHIQKIYGRALNEKDTNKFISLYLQENVPVEVILVLAVHLAPIQKGPAYTARVIHNLFEKKGITSAEKAEEYIATEEKRSKAYTAVCNIFSLDKDKLTNSEKTIINAWYESLGMGEDMIKTAFETARGNASIRYCNGILKSWSQKGYRKPDDIQENYSFNSLTGKNIDDDNDLILKGMNIVPVFNKGE
ncbi:MAG: DnaD domain protein [Oscillospiraceae bacterium]|nr:DnaD domain protein [Oscillospiraceae bacterium]